MSYDWDPDKRLRNIARHGLDFLLAYGFERKTAWWADLRFHYGEVRLVALGTIEDRLYHLTFTIRPPHTRLISFRKASNRELASYEAEA